MRPSQVTLVVKNLLTNAGNTRDTGLSLSWEDTLEQEMEPFSSILAWKIPWAEEPVGLQSMGPQSVGHDSVTEHTHPISYNIL